MARVARYTEQFAVVGTPTHRMLIVAVADRINVDKAPVVREALDWMFDLDDGELKPGDTVEAAVERIVERMRPVRSDEEDPTVAIV